MGSERVMPSNDDKNILSSFKKSEANDTKKKYMSKEADRIAINAEADAYLKMPLYQWRPLLAKECGVYVYKGSYLAKRFDQINYEFCEVDTAKQIVEDNCYALLRYRYFKKSSDDIEKRIQEIIKSFKVNLKTSLLRKSFDFNDADECGIIKQIPEWCVAFKNGVFDFKANKFLFKYDIIDVEAINNRVYQYDPEYTILWYMNFNFEPLSEINIMEIDLDDYKDVLHTLEEMHKNEPQESTAKNLCFELVWNMSHDQMDQFDSAKFLHLCEVLGFLVDPTFVQKFVMFIGAGRNGKNSLIDGCFTNKVIPMPTQNSMVTIEEDKFITGTFENKYHNIYLETDEKGVSLGSSTTLKQLTGSMYQTIEEKGKPRRSGILNVKNLFSANEQEKFKFGDISDGFRRRINMFELFYQYDPDLKFMKRNPDYYNTTYSSDLHEMSNNLLNSTTFIYLAMFGIKSATKGFTKTFEFSRNDWKDEYSDIDTEIKSKFKALTTDKFIKWIDDLQKSKGPTLKTMFLDTTLPVPTSLASSKVLEDFGFSSPSGLWKMLKDEELRNDFFTDNAVFVNLKNIKGIIGEKVMADKTFAANFKKLFPNAHYIKYSNSDQYVKLKFEGQKIKLLNK